MADPAEAENTTDTTLLRRPRRSSILKATRPPLEDVDENVTCEPGDKRRLSKRVSFSDIHEIKVFNREASGELDASADNVLPKIDPATPCVKTDDVFSSNTDTLVAKSHEQHDALEQSFYCSEDGAGNSEAVCHSDRMSLLMEDALSCLVFNGASSVGAARKTVSSDCPNRTTLVSETMDLTCANTSSVCDQLAVDRTTASACDIKSMDMTCANMSSALGQISIASLDGNASTAGLKTMDLTCIIASPVLDQVTTDHVSTADRSFTSGRFNKTMHFHESMDVSSAAEQTLTHCTAAQGGAPSGSDVLCLHETMNITCASGAADVVTDATTSEPEPDAVGCVYQTASGTTAVQSVVAVPKVTITEDSCSVSKPAQRFDLGFVTMIRKFSANDILGDDESPVRTTRDSATVGDPAGIANSVVPCNLPHFLASMRKINASNILEDDDVNGHCVVGASVPVPCDATCSTECRISAEGTEVREISNVTLLPSIDVTSITEHLPVPMSITGLDISGKGILSSAALPSSLDLLSPSANGSWTATQQHDAECTTSCHMSLTCAIIEDGLNDDSLTPAAPVLADITSSGANHEQSNGSISRDGKVSREAARNGGSFSPEKTCLMTVMMDVTGTNAVAPIVIEQEAGLTNGQDSWPIIKACKPLCKGGSSEEAVDLGNLTGLDTEGQQCSSAHGKGLDNSNESARACAVAAAEFPNTSSGAMGTMTPCKSYLETTLTSAPVLMPDSLLDKVALVQPAACSTNSSDAALRESLLPVEATLISYSEATLRHEAAGGMRCIKAAIMITPIRPASSKTSEGKAMSSLKKRLATEIQGGDTLTGKDSIALQQMVSPISCANRSTKAASSLKSKGVNAASNADLGSVDRKFNAFLDSTVNCNISGLDISALLATPIRNNSISGDASLPHISQGKPNAHNDGGDMSKGFSKDRRQQPNSTSCPPLLKSSGYDSLINSSSAADVCMTVSQVAAVEGGVLARQKNTTFVVPSKNTRPSPTLALLFYPKHDVCIDGSAIDENAAGKSELSSAPTDARCASTAPHSSSAKRAIAGPHQSSDKGSCGQRTATTSFKKRLEFTGPHKHPRGVETGSTCNGLKPDMAFCTHPISSSKALSESSGQIPASGHFQPCSELLTSSAGSSGNFPYCAFSYAGSDDEASWLMDIPEPYLVTNSLTAPSTQAVQGDDSATSDQLSLPVDRKKAMLVDGHIPTTSFYSASTAKKRSKPPSTLSSGLPESGRSGAKKHRSTKTGAKSSNCKRRHTPASSNRKRRASQETRSTDVSKQKTKRGCAGVREAENRFTRVALRGEVAVSKNRNDSLIPLFACDRKLRSLPPTPPALLQNILGTDSPEQISQVFAAIQSAEGTDAQALPELPDTSEPVVFDTAEVDITAGINIDDILDRLDDANALESIYWSFTELPQESLKNWELHAIQMEPHKAVFGFIKDTVKLIVSLGDFVTHPSSKDNGALAKRTGRAVPRRTKLISALSFRIKCLPRAHFNQYMLKQLLPERFKTDELLRRYPTTDSLGKILGELGGFIVRHRPLTQDVACATMCRPHSFNYPVLSIQIIAPRRLIWFHLHLPIDLSTYPNAVILPSSRPHSDEYDDINTNKLRRITAHVKPGPKYLTRMVEEIEAFIER